jgi:aminoglycoside phosphotransferase (APT) family kinase protein
LVGAPATGEVICHNDLSPYNAIWRDGLPRAFVDWDLASPGPPMWDIADAAWRFIPVSPDVERSRRATAATKATRLTLLCDAYGLDERGELLQTIHRRIRCSYDTLRKWGQAGVPGWAEMWRAGDHGERMLRCLAYLDEHWRTFARELS